MVEARDEPGRGGLRRLALRLVAVGALALLALVVADRLLARLSPFGAGLVLPPDTVVRYTTDEFDFEVRSNGQGFRGPELERTKRRRRIVALGDSFTYGWGVDGEQTWPAVLERLLRAGGEEVEVANLGQGGVTSDEYARVAERALPVLKPDLVIVGVLQGDDLGQLVLAEGPRGPRGAVKALLTATVPELLARARALRSQPTLDINGQWRAQAQGYVAALDAEGAAWFEGLPPELSTAFLEGNLNPGLVTLARAHPDHLVHTLEPRSAAAEAAVASLAADLDRIRAAAEGVGARVLVVSIPHAAFVSAPNRATYAALGYGIDAGCAETLAMDAAIEDAADAAGVEFLSLTGCMRPAAAEAVLYFERDGHPNAAGYAHIAACLEPAVSAAD